MKKIVFLPLLLMLFSTCRVFSPTYVLEGYLYHDCDKTAVWKGNLELWSIKGFGKTELVSTAITGEDGKFRFEYKGFGGAENMWIMPGDGLSGSIIEYLPQNQDVNIGPVYLKETGELKILLEVSQSYSEQDTLYVAVGGYMGFYPPAFAIPGPFSSGVIDQVEIEKSLVNPDEGYQSVGRGPVRWWVNSNNYENYEEVWYDLHGCDVLDSVTIPLQ